MPLSDPALAAGSVSGVEEKPVQQIEDTFSTRPVAPVPKALI
jgi:hypothetical protein